MRRLLLAVSILFLASCGDDDAAPLDTPPSTVTEPPVSTAAVSSYAYATGADDVVIEVSYENNFMPPQVLSVTAPVALITGVGRAISTGPTTLQFPGPLLPNLRQQSIRPEGIQALLGEAGELGLLTAVEYVGNDRVTDMANTVVTIAVDGATYEHSAYALDFEPESDPARAALSQFVATMTDLAGTVGDELGPDETYEPGAYLVRAQAVDLETMTFEVEPTVVAWPEQAPVRLADVGECAEVPADAVGVVLSEATQLTFYTDGDLTYEVSAVQQYPGRTC
ncbi:MAG: hypothetical protein ACR2HQ_04745 [Ilumatobacteraceae bacterium]